MLPSLRNKPFIYTRGWRRIFLLIFSLALVGAHSLNLAQGETETSSTSAESPMETVKTTLTRILTILDNHKLNAADRRRKVEAIVAERFDYREMSKRTLAAQWTLLSDSDRTQFVELFKTFLADQYAGRIEQYAGEKVEYLGERLEGQYAEIRTKLRSSKTEYSMDYRLINEAGRWQAYDVVADGVSLVRNYRSQFEKILRSDSYQGLVQRLKDRTVKGVLGTKP